MKLCVALRSPEAPPTGPLPTAAYNKLGIGFEKG